MKLSQSCEISSTTFHINAHITEDIPNLIKIKSLINTNPMELAHSSNKSYLIDITDNPSQEIPEKLTISNSTRYNALVPQIRKQARKSHINWKIGITAVVVSSTVFIGLIVYGITGLRIKKFILKLINNPSGMHSQAHKLAI